MGRLTLNIRRFVELLTQRKARNQEELVKTWLLGFKSLLDSIWLCHLCFKWLDSCLKPLSVNSVSMQSNLGTGIKTWEPGTLVKGDHGFSANSAVRTFPC